MDKVKVVIALRKQLNAAKDKLDIMVRPAVVFKELQASKNNLVNLINSTTNNSKTVLGMMLVINKAHINPTTQGNAESLRLAIDKALSKLPSIIDSEITKR